MARCRTNEHQVEVPGEQQQRDVHQAVVKQDRAGKAEAGVSFAVPEQKPRHGEQHREGPSQRGVDLLARVEPPGAARAAKEPAAVVVVEAVEGAQRRRHAHAVADDNDEDERAQPRDAGVQVDCLDERPARDEHAQLRQVEHESRREQGEEAEGEDPVERALGAREPANEAAIAPRDASHGHSSVRPRHRGRSRASPRSHRPV